MTIINAPPCATYLCHSFWTLKTLELALDQPLVLAVCGVWEGLDVLGENNILPVKKLIFRDISSPMALFNLLGSNSGFTTFPLDSLEKWRWQFLAFSESSDVSTNFGLSHLGCHGTEGPIHTWMAPPSVVQETAQHHITHLNKWALRAYHEPGPDGGWGFSREQADRAPVLIRSYPSP